MPKRYGTGAAVMVPYQVFETADRPLCLAAGNDRLWARCAWVRNKGELIPLNQAALRGSTRAEWRDALAVAGVPSGPVNDTAELMETEQPAAVGVLQDLPEGGLRVVGLPIQCDRRRRLSACRA